MEYLTSTETEVGNSTKAVLISKLWIKCLLMKKELSLFHIFLQPDVTGYYKILFRINKGIDYFPHIFATWCNRIFTYTISEEILRFFTILGFLLTKHSVYNVYLITIHFWIDVLKKLLTYLYTNYSPTWTLTTHLPEH